MNATEKQAYQWLQRQGYDAEQIQFQRRNSPDFLTADGKGWEVKLARKAAVVFYSGQVERLRECGRETFVVVFASPEATDPVLVVPFADIEVPGNYQQYRFMGLGPRQRIIALRMTDAEYSIVRDAARADSRSMSDFARVTALNAARKGKEVAHRTS